MKRSFAHEAPLFIYCGVSLLKSRFLEYRVHRVNCTCLSYFFRHPTLPSYLGYIPVSLFGSLHSGFVWLPIGEPNFTEDPGSDLLSKHLYNPHISAQPFRSRFNTSLRVVYTLPHHPRRYPLPSASLHVIALG
ncbi:hypothetical protein K439DRAFT_210018 [Ramaria rubella]|nr:hypothetical protein K439DRAFT_210018 [Ramaria rubella]